MTLFRYRYGQGSTRACSYPGERRRESLGTQASSGLKLEDDGGAARLEVDGGGTAVLVAEDGGAEAQSKTRYFAGSLGWNERVKGTFRIEEGGARVGHKNPHNVPLGSCLKPDGLGSGLVPSRKGALFVCRLNGKLQAVEHCLPQ